MKKTKGKTLMEVFEAECLFDDDIQELDEDDLQALEALWEDQEDLPQEKKKGKRWRNTNARRKTPKG